MSKKGFVNSLLLSIVTTATVWLMRFWFGSCRVIVHGEENFYTEEEAEEKTIVATFWHYSIVFIIYYLRNYSATALVSTSGDGEYIARLVQKLGFKTARGSRNRGGTQALKALVRVVREGGNCAIVADGSQGPPRIAQPGSILLASKSGGPVVPLVWSASSYFTVNSWDRMAIPKPFSRVDFFFGEAFYVPANLAKKELLEYQQKLEDKLNGLYDEAWKIYGKTEH